jgi:hypothetical protein
VECDLHRIFDKNAWTFYPSQDLLLDLISVEEGQLLVRESLVAGGGEDPGRPTYAESYGHLDGPSSYVPIFTDIDLDYAEPISVRDQFYQTGFAAPQYAHYPLLPPVKALLHPNIVIHARTAALLAGASRTPVQM